MAKYVIEVHGPNSERVIFAPVGTQPLRGRLDVSHVGGRRMLPIQQDFFAKVKTVPGLYIELDTERQQGRILDPLQCTEDGRVLLEKINDVLSRSSLRSVTGGQKKAWDTVEYKLKADGVKEWAFHMRTLIDCDLAKHCPGSAQLPSAEEICQWHGKMRRDPLSDNREFTPEYPQYISEVTNKKAATAAN